MVKEPKFKPGDKWYAGSLCNGYKKGDVLEIKHVIGSGKKKKLDVINIEQVGSVVSYKTLWKKCK